MEPRVAEALRRYWGFESLRPMQDRSIAATLAGRDSLTVMPTGGGKSLCFQLPPLVTGTLTLVVSPLIALMDDQVAALRVAGVPAAALHSQQSPEAATLMREQLASGELRLLLTSPERVLSGPVRELVSKLARGGHADCGGLRLGHIAVDEAHCISQWGHDFRPEFRRMRELRSGALAEVPIGAYTATATPRVRRDIVEQLGLRSPVELVGGFDRPNLTYRILPRVRVVDQVAEAIGRHSGRAAIVYCLSRKNTEEVATALCGRGIEARAYHAGMDGARRSKVAADFRAERLDVVVATVAFGMGIDRGDVRLVVHASMPKSIEHYQQETGRAGRDGLPAECLLLYSAQDVLLWRDLMSKPSPDGVTASDEVLQHGYEMLEQMHRFASGAKCRHRALTEYFGQEYGTTGGGGGGCGACDYCLDELLDAPDGQEVARKIVSCVARVNQGRTHEGNVMAFGAGHITDILTGSRAEKILRLGHDKLSTHGLLKHVAKPRLMSYVNQLIDQDVLERSGQFSVLLLTERSRALLRNELTVRLVDPKASLTRTKREQVATGETSPLSAVEMAVFEDLRVWRREEASRRGVPPYVILGDATLEELCRVRPGSAETLVTVRGIGTRKAEEFGAALLAALGVSCATHGLAMDVRTGTRAGGRSVRREDGGDEGPSRTRSGGGGSGGGAGLDAAAAHFARGAGVEDVIQALGRARSTVMGYFCQWLEQEPCPVESIDAWVPRVVQERIVEAWKASGRGSALRPVWERLNPEGRDGGAGGGEGGGIVGYDEIRVTLTFARVMGW
jgi:ATP-dependent DNA helicase RecQ